MREVLLHVEGKDDFHVIINLLALHSIECFISPPPDSAGKDRLFSMLEPAIKASTGKSIGFLFDANGDIDAKWRRVTITLNRLGVETPEMLPENGFIGVSEGFKATVGIWFMPNNRTAGTIETFLQYLIDERDRLISYARESTEVAKSLGAKVSALDTEKAILHVWLAWQEEPGLPYGTALKARYFGHCSPTAISFLHWFRSLFQII